MQKGDEVRGFLIFHMASVLWGVCEHPGKLSPGSIPELMAYMSLIIRVSREYTGTAWWNYDVLF